MAKLGEARACTRMFEWDEGKNRANFRKHGIDFEAATDIFDGRPVFQYSSPRGDEVRIVTVGLIDDRHYLVVWIQRGERRRIISAYRADDWEIREYRALHG